MAKADSDHEVHPGGFIPGPHPFDILAIKAEYIVQDPGSVKHENIFYMRFRAKQKLRFVERRYRWTGTGPHRRPEVLSGHEADGRRLHRVHGPVIADGENRIYLIDLGRDLSRGEEEEIKLREIFLDELGSFKPFNSYEVRQELEHLELTAKLPQELSRHVRVEITNVQHNELVEPSRQIQKSDESGIYQLTVDQPEIGLRYAIKWLY